MDINREKIVELQNLHEDIAGYFCDDYKVCLLYTSDAADDA